MPEGLTDIAEVKNALTYTSILPIFLQGVVRHESSGTNFPLFSLSKGTG
jgi:hypothetical protein